MELWLRGVRDAALPRPRLADPPLPVGDFGKRLEVPRVERYRLGFGEDDAHAAVFTGKSIVFGHVGGAERPARLVVRRTGRFAAQLAVLNHVASRSRLLI